MSISGELDMKIFRLFKEGDVEEASKLFENNGMDYLETSPTDKWNWLHQLLMGFNSNKPPRKTIDFFIQNCLHCCLNQSLYV